MYKRLEQLLELYRESEDDPFVIYALAKEYEKADRFTEALEIS